MKTQNPNFPQSHIVPHLLTTPQCKICKKEIRKETRNGRVKWNETKTREREDRVDQQRTGVVCVGDQFFLRAKDLLRRAISFGTSSWTKRRSRSWTCACCISRRSSSFRSISSNVRDFSRRQFTLPKWCEYLYDWNRWWMSLEWVMRFWSIPVLCYAR